MSHETTLEQIAREHLGLETLATRKRDSLDFKEQAVWSIKSALEAAYHAGAERSCLTSPAGHDTSAQPRWTPGPWKIKAPKPARFPEYQVHAAGGRIVSLPITAHGNEFANGTLIAAAPGLYEALLLCEAAIADHDPEPVEGTYWHKPLLKVRAALAKATQA